MCNAIGIWHLVVLEVQAMDVKHLISGILTEKGEGNSRKLSLSSLLPSYGREVKIDKRNEVKIKER
jgi:hypothetical protein